MVMKMAIDLCFIFPAVKIACLCGLRDGRPAKNSPGSWNWMKGYSRTGNQLHLNRTPLVSVKL